MSAPSPARRMRARVMSFALWVSALAFLIIENDALLDQSEIGHASVLFMFGTACLAAAACIGLFAIIMAIGLAISAAFSDDPSEQQSDHIQDTAAAPLANTDDSPDVSWTLGRPSTRRQQPLRPTRTVSNG